LQRLGWRKGAIFMRDRAFSSAGIDLPPGRKVADKLRRRDKIMMRLGKKRNCWHCHYILNLWLSGYKCFP